MEGERSSRQHLILVASLLDRIPNLAGLARTCEVCYESYNDNFCLCSSIMFLQSFSARFLLQHCSYQVFKASSLAIADTNVLHDKQFQLIRFVDSSLPSIGITLYALY